MKAVNFSRANAVQNEEGGRGEDKGNGGVGGGGLVGIWKGESREEDRGMRERGVDREMRGRTGKGENSGGEGVANWEGIEGEGKGWFVRRSRGGKGRERGRLWGWTWKRLRRGIRKRVRMEWKMDSRRE